ncbi:MAG: hypothetical protein LBN34_03125 [Clostridiales Family XIII bacterium]|nr:hypothetical protein [Clostridiales Family XIII bacterium]
MTVLLSVAAYNAVHGSPDKKSSSNNTSQEEKVEREPAKTTEPTPEPVKETEPASEPPQKAEQEPSNNTNDGLDSVRVGARQSAIDSLQILFYPDVADFPFVPDSEDFDNELQLFGEAGTLKYGGVSASYILMFNTSGSVDTFMLDGTYYYYDGEYQG